MTKKKPPKLIVVFDTNVLYTQVASDLVRNDIQRIINENSSHPDLSIQWYLPQLVVEERKFQMLKKAKELLPNLKKIERLLGHSFGVEADTLELHVDKTIKNSIEELKLQIADLSTKNVDWGDVITRSVKRLPPFEDNEKEKGFRDAVIANSFFQLHNSSPVTPSICKLVFISDDNVLKQYISETLAGAVNVRILSSLDDLEGLINTLISTLPEEFAQELKKKASKLFFEKENEKSFYYKEAISDKIKERYGDVLEKTIKEGCLRDNGTWWISEPIFVKKHRQRIHWINSVEPEFEIFHYDVASEQSGDRGISDEGGIGLGILGEPDKARTFRTLLPPPGLLGIASPPKKVTDLKGRERFEVHWSTNLTQAHNLTSPRLEGIKYSGNNLAETNHNI